MSWFPRGGATSTNISCSSEALLRLSLVCRVKWYKMTCRATILVVIAVMKEEAPKIPEYFFQYIVSCLNGELKAASDVFSPKTRQRLT